jgi:hypothetical protein
MLMVQLNTAPMQLNVHIEAYVRTTAKKQGKRPTHLHGCCCRQQLMTLQLVSALQAAAQDLLHATGHY